MIEDWDHIYASGEYRNHWDYAHPSQELVAFVASTPFPPQARALDVGCGAGREAVFLAEYGFRVVGVDLSREALRIADQRASKKKVEVEWRHGNALRLPLEDGAFDLMNDRGCFHLISEEERGRYASEAARVLKPGGRLLLRGCRNPDENGEWFVAVTAEAIDRHFSSYFERGPVLPLQLVSDAGKEGLPANLVVLTRRQDG
ncbi:class I SAM-dependent methyltransferase [Desmospora profundinema]|uniref:Ubiquinone/menaquinone biosynthesis C-methylase UbiE n=1 Tax=Desmospora profundinema TaxID=1571184 RepID=A0ABU1IMF8_9BACL|nr:class I SAM-dependent methyltransferase [Desmospora profundinema]MDR6225960.1 ubiquinone/menaquinone biosynthesis C-methylase UbiE [Desmospora profundinema]